MHARYLPAPLVVGLVLLSLLTMAPGGAHAQDTPQVGITVTGVGEASAPADTAELQLLLVTADFFGGPPEEFEPDATPAAPGDMEASLATVVEAIVAEGVDESAIAVVLSPTSGDRFGRGDGSVGRIDLTVAEPTRDGLNSLLAAADAAAMEHGLMLTQVGVAFDLEDCAAVEREARLAAIEDAQARAEVHAELLGVQIGPVTASSDSPYFGLIGPAPCGFSGSSYSSEGYGIPVTLPSYDPGAEPEVEVYVLLNLTFAIAQG